MGIHICLVLLIVLVGTNKTVQQKAKESISIFVPDLAPYEPPIAKQTKKAGGGGGGGDRSLLEASKGKLPRVAPKQFTPPMVVVNNPDPKLVKVFNGFWDYIWIREFPTDRGGRQRQGDSSPPLQ